MGTRTNFYKNPSYAYNKQFKLSSVLQNLHSYNIATGNAPSDEAATVVKHKCRRRSRPPSDRPNEAEHIDGPMSHQEYIAKRRKEAASSQAYHELSSDILESSSALNLVGYESDSITAECEEGQDPPRNVKEQLNYSCELQYSPTSASMEKDQIKASSEQQRYPTPGEPVCVMCGKYGEYICNETDDDVCSIECKGELLQNTKFLQEQPIGEGPVGPFSTRRCNFELAEFGGHTWDFNSHHWSKKKSGLCTYECWKCQKPGHLAEDCMVSPSQCDLIPAAEVYKNVSVQNKSNTIPRELHGLYKRCHQIGKKYFSTNCNSCRGTTTLAACISCDTAFCDCAGHLSKHIRENPTHQQYYSYKLKRLVKCCKSTCKVTHIKDLLACHYCFDKAFDKFYDMYTATWKPSGLSIIWNSICCEDHFEWHRMNCLNAGVEDSAYILKHEHGPSEKHAPLSDFIF